MIVQTEELVDLCKNIYTSFNSLQNNNSIKEKSNRYGIPLLFDRIDKSFCDLVFTILIEPLCETYHKIDIQGNNFNERTAFFIEHMSKRKNLNKLFDKYPVVKEKLKMSISTREKAILNFFYDYEQDLEEIANIFSKRHFKIEAIDFSKGEQDLEEIANIFSKRHFKIEAIDFSKGDQHDGKTVLVVEFSDDSDDFKLVYKPRNLDIDELIYKLVSFISESEFINTDFLIPKFVNKNNHSWQEFIITTPFRNADEIHDFYYKAGVYLGVFLLFGTCDLHYENILVVGSNPVFIDLEALGIGETSETFQVTKFNVPNASVLNTYLLPIKTADNIIDVNISGLFPQKEQSKKIEVFNFHLEEGKEWIFEKSYFESEPETDKLTYEGKFIEPELVSEDLKIGFSIAVETIIKNKNIVEKIILDTLDKNIQIRQILRPTQVYAKFLEASNTRDYLSSFEKQDELFDILLMNFNAGDKGYFRVEKEISELKKGNIPSFYMKSNSVDLYDKNEVVIPKYFSKTYKQSLLERLDCLSIVDIKLQNRFIDMSLATYYPTEQMYYVNESDNNLLFSPKDTYKNILSSYLDYIDSITLKIDKNRYEYFTLQNTIINSNETFCIEGSSFGLYDSGGLIMFLINFKNDKSIEIGLGIYNVIMEKFNALVKTNPDKINIGVFSGLGGVAFISHYLFREFSEEKYLENFNEVISVIKSACIEKKAVTINDYVSGMSGVITLLTNILKNSNDTRNQDDLNILVEIFMENLVKTNDYSLSHGKLGECMALMNLYDYYGDEVYFNMLELNLKDVYQELPEFTNTYTWCRGIVGLYLVISKYSEMFPEKAGYYLEQLESITPEMIDSMLSMGNQSICHGSVGNYISLKRIKKFLNNNSKKYLIEKKDILVNPFKHKWVKGSSHIADSFMLGATGVCYAIDLDLKYDELQTLFLNLEM